MEAIRLPRDVIDRPEHRWASRPQQDANAWSIARSKPMQARHVLPDDTRANSVIVKRARGANANSARA